MRLPYNIAITLGFITCLSSFMLGLGQNDFLLPFLMFLAVVSSLYLTDFRRIIRLGDWTVNVLVLLIVFLTIGDIVRNQAEDLAFSIARTLVFVEMVLLFREKAPRFCWQILLISLLQVVVATVMQQSLLFGLLLILYVFSGLCAFVLIFLQKENRYFRRHSFIDTFIDSLKAEIAARHDRGRLVRIALGTLIAGPLSLVLSFSPSQRSNERRQADPNDSRWDLVRSLFAVFPHDQESRAEHWEQIGESHLSSSSAWHEKLWDDQASSGAEGQPVRPDAHNQGGRHGSITDKRLVPVPRSEKSRTEPVKHPPSRRFPLLEERPSFSAGTMHSSGLEGGRKELFVQLVWGTLFSLFVAVILFSLIPRIGKIEFWNYTFHFGHENWTKSFRSPVGSIGFKEEIRLGSLGTILPYHREVMTVSFMNLPERRIPDRTNLAAHETPYSEIQGATVYFRGIALDHYSRGVWSPPQNKFEHTDPDQAQSDGRIRDYLSNLGSATQIPFVHPILGIRPGIPVRQGMSSELFFDPESDLVALHMTVQPLDSRIFFAPWPFFTARHNLFQHRYLTGGSIQEMRLRDRVLNTVIYTPVYKHGMQLPLVPCQETIDRTDLLQLPGKGLEKLVSLARTWDDASGLSEDDIIGRAAYMEHQFLFSDQFQYKLGKTTRDYSLDPLEDFIGRNSQGHCEYFAGALALMLRSVGIGARVIIGFKSDVTGSGDHGCTVRQSDAHAWVEVHIPPDLLGDRYDESNPWWSLGAWYRLDPTPAATDQTVMQRFSFNWNDLKDWVEKAWGDLVLNMNSQKQSAYIYQPIHNALTFLLTRIFASEFWTSTIPGIVNYYKDLFSKESRAVWNARDWFLLAVPILLFAALAYLLVRLLRPIWASLRGASEEARRRKASIDFYRRMERILAEIGQERRPAETPLEYIRHFDFTAETGPIVDAFYRVKFGSAVLSHEELAGIRERLDRLERHISEQNTSKTHESA